MIVSRVIVRKRSLCHNRTVGVKKQPDGALMLASVISMPPSVLYLLRMPMESERKRAVGWEWWKEGGA